MILDKHWWRTADGDLVPDGNPEAAILAYTRGQEIPDATAKQLGILADESDEKAKPAPANKARTRPADK